MQRLCLLPHSPLCCMCRVLCVVSPAHEGPSPYVGDAKLDALLQRFLEGDDEFRNQRYDTSSNPIQTDPWITFDSYKAPFHTHPSP